MTPADAMALKARLKEKFKDIVKDRVFYRENYTGEKFDKLDNLAKERIKKLSDQEYSIDKFLDEQLDELTKQFPVPKPVTNS